MDQVPFNKQQVGQIGQIGQQVQIGQLGQYEQIEELERLGQLGQFGQFGQQSQFYNQQQQQQELQQQTNIIQEQQPPKLQLLNPTPYHEKQKQVRINRAQKPTVMNGNVSPAEGAPPTPVNSFTNNPTIESVVMDTTRTTNFIPINNSQFSHCINANTIKQESSSPDIHQSDLDFDTSSSGIPIISPQSNSPLESPPNHNTFFDTEESQNHYDNHQHLGTNSPFESSPHNSYNSFSPISASLPINLATASTDPWYGSYDPAYQPGIHRNQSLMLYSSTTPEQNLLASVDFMGGNEVQKNEMMNEKKRRRRESHNAVERRRRDNINEQIQELSRLLPEMFMDSTNKPNKGLILRKSVDYIKFLKQQVDYQKTQLEEKIKPENSNISSFSIGGESIGNIKINNNNNNNKNSD